ncbi:MAG: TonB-dependent receptor [Gammaproteobacteria bacterium]|nr:TonB-dependent receptor [Gammaproteobacteria bacterium]
MFFFRQCSDSGLEQAGPDGAQPGRQTTQGSEAATGRDGHGAESVGMVRPVATPPPCRRGAVGLAVSGLLGAGLAHSGMALAQGAGSGAEGTPMVLDTIDVIEFRGERMNSPRYTRDLLDTPRIITVLPKDLLEEQNVTSLRDAMRNIPGISLQAGEGNPPGGDQLKIRGFNARDDINVNGIRDLGNYFRDPFYVEQLEVVKGPNSAFNGRGSAGGTINFVTKKPSLQPFNRVEASVGTDEYVRATVDVNQPIDDNSAFRLNFMGHSADVPGRDVVNDERWGLFGAYTWGFRGDTLVTADWLHTSQDNLEDKGLPLDREGFTGSKAECDDPTNDRVGRVGNQRCGDGFATGKLPDAVDFDDFFGHVDDFQDIDVDIVNLGLEHAFSDNVLFRTNFRYSLVENDSITSSPRIKVNPADFGSGDFSKALVQGDLKPRDQEDEGYFNQTDLVFNFDTGGISHDLVTGFEAGRFTYENRRRPDVKGPRTSLLNPERRTRPAAPFASEFDPGDPGESTVHEFETEEFAVFVLDTLQFSPQWELNAGVRWDRVEAEVSEEGRPDAISLSRTDKEWSYSLGLVYKPVPNASLYASYGTAFEISGNFDRGVVQLAGGPDSRVTAPDGSEFDVDPEETEAYEIGVKWRVLEGLDINAALFRTDKTKARLQGLGADDPGVLDTEQRIDGFELLVAGQVTPRWRLFGGYTFLDSEVRKSAAFPQLEGQELGGTPEHSFNVFTTYDLTPRFSVGGGLQYVDDQISAPQPVLDPPPRRRNVSIDDYTVVDLYTTYKLTKNAQIRVNAFNIFDKEYISQLAEGGAQGIPGKARHVIATLRYDF